VNREGTSWREGSNYQIPCQGKILGGGAKVVRLAEPRTGANPSSSDAVLEYVMNLARLQSQSITAVGWNKARVSTGIPIHTNEIGIFSEERRVYKPRVLHLNEQ
jgi:hypothetical protein